MSTDRITDLKKNSLREMMRPFGRADDIIADSGAEGEEMQKGKN